MPFRPSDVLWGMLLRCPKCRRGRIFRTFFRTHHTCPRCDYEFALGHGEFTGAMMLAQFVWGVVALYGWFYLEFYTAASADLKAAWIVVMGLVFPVLSYRHIKGAWVGIVRAGEELWDEPALPDQDSGLGMR